jgi:hypothetical protein
MPSKQIDSRNAHLTDHKEDVVDEEDKKMAGFGSSRQGNVLASEIDIKRKRNAMYSQRKYYRKKQRVESLKLMKLQLQSDNQVLRQSNKELESTIQSANAMIAKTKASQNHPQTSTNVTVPLIGTMPIYQNLELPTTSSVLTNLHTSLYPNATNCLSCLPKVPISTLPSNFWDTASILHSIQVQAAQAPPLLGNYNMLNNDALHSINNRESMRAHSDYKTSEYLQQPLPASASSIHAFQPMLLPAEQPIVTALSPHVPLFRQNSNPLPTGSPFSPFSQGTRPLESSMSSLLLHQYVASSSAQQANVSFEHQLDLHLRSSNGDLSRQDALRSTIGFRPALAALNDTPSVNDTPRSNVTQHDGTLTVSQMLLLQQLQDQQSRTLTNAATALAQQHQSNIEMNTLLQYYLSLSRK